VPTETLRKRDHRVPPAMPAEEDELRTAARAYVKRVRRLKINAALWALGTVVVTTIWAIHEWQANGAFERFGTGGNPGDWSPTLWALAVAVSGLLVGIEALRVYFERPGHMQRWKFHIAAWVLGMLVLTPLWALIEWQDNGGFRRWSNDGRPGDWEPWILYVGGVWALVIAVRALQSYFDRAATDEEIDREVRRLAPHR
jgi:hypothetical protein